MARVGFRMQLQPGNEAEYKRRHDEIWPELAQLLHDGGVRNYSIYRDGLTLFAYLETDNPTAMAPPPKDSIIWKWWAYMEPLMVCNPDASPKVTPLVEVFHLD